MRYHGDPFFVPLSERCPTASCFVRSRFPAHHSGAVPRTNNACGLSISSKRHCRIKSQNHCRDGTSTHLISTSSFCLDTNGVGADKFRRWLRGLHGRPAMLFMRARAQQSKRAYPASGLALKSPSHPMRRQSILRPPECPGRRKIVAAASGGDAGRLAIRSGGKDASLHNNLRRSAWFHCREICWIASRVSAPWDAPGALSERFEEEVANRAERRA